MPRWRRRSCSMLITVETPDDALAAADAADKARGSGDLASLAGIPLGIKDLFATQGVDTTAGSNILKGFKPPYESTVTANLRKAGRGDARQTEHGRVRDGLVQRDQRLWTGDLARGGARAAMSASRRAARRAARRRQSRRTSPPASTGTDTGGSIRQPAAFVGICGIKPTYGRCSRWGIVSFASSLDQAGPMARTVRDCAILLEAMAGFDPKDSTSLDLPVPQWEADLSSDLSGKRVGIPKEYRIDGVPAEINALVGPGHRMAERRGRNARRDQPAAHQICAADLLHHRASRGVVQPRPLRRRPLRPARGGREDPRRHVCRNPRGGLRRRGQAADHDRHLRALGRLLRRLFHQGAEGADADQAGLRARRSSSAT